MATVRGISETSIVFDGNNGHSHDGTAENGSLIDVTKYSIYDFSPTKINTADNQRSIRQDNNINAFNNKVAEIVNTLVLRPAGIILQEETLNGNYIIANTVTSSQIAANTITASEIAANTITTNELTSDVLKSSNYSYTSGTYSNAGTFFDLADGAITSKKFAIDSSGNAFFSGDISGANITGSTISGGTLTIARASGDYVQVSESGVLLKEDNGGNAPILKFDTSAGTYTHTILSDKQLKIASGGSGGRTFIYIGNTGGGSQGSVNIEATDLTLKGTSVSLDGHTHNYADPNHNHSGVYADSGHNHSGVYADSGHNHSGVYADSGHNHSGVYADSSHNHSGVYSTTSHLHDSRYELLGHTHNYLSTISGGTVNGAVNFKSNSFRLSGLASVSISGELRISSAGYLYRFSSLRKLKNNIHSSGKILEYLNEKNPIYYLNPVIFKPINDIEKEDSYLHGFIAEEVAEVMPEMSVLDENGELSVYKASTMTPLLVAEIQRLGRMVEELYALAFPDWQPPLERSEASVIESRENMARYAEFIKNGGLEELEF